MCYVENEFISMLEFLIDNIFVEFGGHNFQQIIDIHMGTNCVHFIADLFLCFLSLFKYLPKTKHYRS